MVGTGSYQPFLTVVSWDIEITESIQRKHREEDIISSPAVLAGWFSVNRTQLRSPGKREPEMS